MTTPTRGSQLTPGAIRTATPFLVGYLVSFLARHGLDINDDNASYLIGAGGGYAYYFFARLLEVFVSEKWRYVLGLGLAGSTAVYSKVDPPGDPVDRAADNDRGESLLGMLGIVLVLIGVLLLILGLLNAIAVNTSLIVVAIVIGVVLVVVDRGAGSRL